MPDLQHRLISVLEDDEVKTLIIKARVTVKSETSALDVLGIQLLVGASRSHAHTESKFKQVSTTHRCEKARCLVRICAIYVCLQVSTGHEYVVAARVELAECLYLEEVVLSLHVGVEYSSSGSSQSCVQFIDFIDNLQSVEAAAYPDVDVYWETVLMNSLQLPVTMSLSLASPNSGKLRQIIGATC